MAKPKVAFYWCSSCGGCEEAVVDLNEDILKVVEAVDIIFWPVAMDFKRSDVEAMGDGEITASFINGAIRTSEQEEMVKLLREKSGLVFAFGSCAHLGGIPGLANFWNRETIFNRLYKEIPTNVNPDGTLPQTKTVIDGKEVTLPEFWDTVHTLDQVIDVDYFIPGCAPPPDIIMNAFTALLEGNLPEKGSVLAPEKSLCDTCHRAETKPEKLLMKEIKRPHLTETDPEKCFLEQGIICLGPSTRSGCGERCINANMPCRGCFGPNKGILDHGAKSLSAIASLLSIEDEEEISDEEVLKRVNQIADPAGLFYMYSLASSLLQRKKMV